MPGANFVRIKLNGTVFPQITYFNNPESLIGLFRHSYTLGLRATCLCSANCPELYIAQRNGSYYLAKMPDTGPFHDSNCEFYQSPDTDSGRSTYLKGVIVDHDGLIDVKIGIPFKIQRDLSKIEDTAKLPNANKSQSKRSAIELLGLLHLLWEYSNNSRWFPRKKGKANLSRSWGSAHYYLGQVLEKISTKGKALKDNLYIVPPYHSSEQDQIQQQFDRFITPVIKSGTVKAQADKVPVICKMIIGEVKDLTESKFGFCLKLKSFYHPLYLSKAKMERLQKSYSLAVNAIASEKACAIAIAVVSASSSGNLTIESIAMMPVSKNYIPFDSSFELQIGNMLIDQERAFEKPMRYDNEALTLPDFILCDAKEHPRMPMEIYGMTGNTDYDVRKNQKKEIYAQTGLPCWVWEPANQIEPPPFPLKRDNTHETE